VLPVPFPNLLESIGQIVNRLEIYTEIPPTEAMNEEGNSTRILTIISEMIIKILVELLSTLALTTKETKQGNLVSPSSVRGFIT
jgi:hypothetical protein